MAESINPLVGFSDHVAQLVERTGSSIVAVHGGGRGSSSGIHWRSGVIVTAEEVLERDEDVKITLPSGRLVEASLAGRDPSTDVAVLRFQPDGLPAASTADAAPLRPGHVVLAVGNHEGAPIASLGVVATVGGPWHSLRGGTIDNLIRVDLVLSRAAEGGALIDAQGGVVGYGRRRAAKFRSIVDHPVPRCAPPCQRCGRVNRFRRLSTRARRLGLALAGGFMLTTIGTAILGWLLDHWGTRRVMIPQC